MFSRSPLMNKVSLEFQYVTEVLRSRSWTSQWRVRKHSRTTLRPPRGSRTKLLPRHDSTRLAPRTTAVRLRRCGRLQAPHGTRRRSRGATARRLGDRPSPRHTPRGRRRCCGGSAHHNRSHRRRPYFVPRTANVSLRRTYPSAKARRRLYMSNCSPCTTDRAGSPALRSSDVCPTTVPV